MKKKEVKQVFSKNKQSYVTSSTHSKGSDLPLVTKWLKPQSHMVALDVATGGGHVAKQLAPSVNKIVATDITAEMLENTASHLSPITNIDYVIADAEDLPFLNHSFDIVTCRIAAHHFPNPEKFISEVQRVLKTNGKFLLIDNIASERMEHDHFYNSLEKMRDYSHNRSLKVSEWRQLLTKYNLSIQDQQVKKKTLIYEDWINRTLDSKEDMDRVNSFIQNASEEIQRYYQIKIVNEVIQSFTIDEWMVLCQKK
ncbi:ubiquinone/menaquinone biosynthesis C-methylase UbiE [Virgibacillus natechei]|uniref:Ubiquinone/menaquinone biosynthesis C-methylase UbiE n=1 Tax=Virgibacillus natechei TaxID=1216297 RepID=A0ABS4IBY9_9BACI|nr:class I SAM-dependent methyltransferase [Virgibacillus natechei]MBP1968165.1 ubiquinone/menaquinone biosynthesis C-methylase UbiE [Virgibacillus natechei]UZD14559.1 class I SAM-dependent methyltransferase [Virgibacillus natechei]